LSSSGVSSDLSVATPLGGEEEGEGVSRGAMARLGVCGVIFACLLAWAVLFPYTGDGDSALHYLDARDTTVTPVSCLHAWARPLAKIVMVPFAMHGILLTRAAMAMVSAVVAWQTIRFAEEIGLRHALLAGAMIFWQPMVFAVAADTMTEMVMALGVIIALRLWRNGYWRVCALLIGFLPAVRPEGFFLGVMWGIMVLRMEAPGDTFGKRTAWRIGTLLLMTVGLLCWATACWALTFNHDVLYVLHIWNWPAASFAGYGRGTILHHVIWWPVYCGVPLCVLFVVGIGGSWRNKAMELPWAVWLLVFGLHTVLYWGGWFASCGLMRIFACTSPITAMVCLFGWNRVERWIGERNERVKAGGRFARRWISPRGAGACGVVLCTVYMMASYALTASHYDCFPMGRCVDYIRDRGLLRGPVWFFAGNQMATAQLDFPGNPARVMESPCDRELIRRNLAALPMGSIGVWDDRQARKWHGHGIDDLAGHGFTVLYEASMWAPSYQSLLLGSAGCERLRYVVLRKDGVFEN
jgi:hypothetical protein